MAETKTTKAVKAQQASGKSAKQTASEKPKLFAVVRIRGEVGVNGKLATNMELLRLHKKHRCVLVLANDNYMGMLSKAKDYCTFGEADEETVKLLIESRGKLVANKKLTAEFLKQHKLTYESFAKKLVAGEIRIKDIEGVKPFFKLSPPKGGFARGGIKKPYSMRGVLGYRGAEINKLIRKMI